MTLRDASLLWLYGGLALLVLAILYAARARARAEQRFGAVETLRRLAIARSPGMRAFRATLVCIALALAIPGDKPEMKRVRFRTLGCYPLTGAIESSATTLPEIIEEMLVARNSERQGRVIDHDSSGSMEKKKQEGYF